MGFHVSLGEGISQSAGCDRDNEGIPSIDRLQPVGPLKMHP